MLRNRSPPIEPSRAEAPITATLRGSKNGRSDAVTATWSRSATRVREARRSAAIGKLQLDLAALDACARPRSRRRRTRRACRCSRPAPRRRSARCRASPRAERELLEQARADPAALLARRRRRTRPRPPRGRAGARSSRARRSARARRRRASVPTSAPRSAQSGSRYASTSRGLHAAGCRGSAGRGCGRRAARRTRRARRRRRPRAAAGAACRRP